MSNHRSEDPRASSRDAALERAWRETSAELPPSHVDATIIAAAHQSVRGRGEQLHTVPVHDRSRKWRTQWQPLAAAAVVAGLAFGLVQTLPREHDLAPSIQWQESTPVPASAEPHPESRPQTGSQPERASSSARETVNIGQPPSADRAVDQGGRVGARDRAPQNAVPAPPAAPAAPASTANDDVAETNASVTASKAETTASATAPAADNPAALGEISADRRKAVESPVAERAATTAAAAPSPRASEGNRGYVTQLDSPSWAARVAALHASGDLTAAEHALREFRVVVADADTYLPDSLRSWARTVE